MSSDHRIPADILLLKSSDPGGICYIETANLDGETNLKQREVAPGSFMQVGTRLDPATGLELEKEFDPEDFTGKLYCEQPHNKIYDFNGYM